MYVLTFAERSDTAMFSVALRRSHECFRDASSAVSVVLVSIREVAIAVAAEHLPRSILGFQKKARARPRHDIGAVPPQLGIVPGTKIVTYLDYCLYVAI